MSNSAKDTTRFLVHLYRSKKSRESRWICRKVKDENVWRSNWYKSFFARSRLGRCAQMHNQVTITSEIDNFLATIISRIDNLRVQ